MTFPPSVISTDKNVRRQYLEETFTEPVLRSFFGKHRVLWILFASVIVWLVVTRPLSIAFGVSTLSYFAYLTTPPVVIAEAVIAFVLLHFSFRSTRAVRRKLKSLLENGGQQCSDSSKEAFSNDDIAVYMLVGITALIISVNFLTLLWGDSYVFSYGSAFAVFYSAFSTQHYDYSPVFTDSYYAINQWTISYSAIARIEAPKSEVRRRGKRNESYGLWFYNAEGKLVGRDRLFTADAVYLREKIQSLEVQQ
ncbi:MAG: hypothetical protein LBN97_09950 [Oscillospiraceae bacterium]|jgi:hypothetical protein|nr:hypothetical protein [Oscillospiraceae bacterium]